MALVNRVRSGHIVRVADQRRRQRHARRLPAWGRVALALLGGFVLVGVAAVGWIAWTAHETWSRLEAAQDRLHVPARFRRIATVRTGHGFCFVSCTGGGEATVTVLLDVGNS